ncbi:MAG: FixH family protein, partial [Betaproteobacteria bacterium]|nr:FixH family protein [Betaproteobacteria bacterium]
MTYPNTAKTPWFREPWPWLLMAGPAAAVIAGIATLMLAIQSYDGLVADDYYKRGLAVNQTLQRDSAATALGMAATVWLDTASHQVRVDMQGQGLRINGLTLTLANATRAGKDRVIALQAAPDGHFSGFLGELPAGKWHLSLEDSTHFWRLT